MPTAATVAEDSGATLINVLANDTIGPDAGETLTVTAVTQGAHGTVTFTATGVSYTPAANYFGPDSFTYTISDGNGGSATATRHRDGDAGQRQRRSPTPTAATVAEDSGATVIDVLANDTHRSRRRRDAHRDRGDPGRARRGDLHRDRRQLHAGRQLLRGRQLHLHDQRRQRRQRHRDGHHHRDARQRQPGRHRRQHDGRGRQRRDGHRRAGQRHHRSRRRARRSP